jgi:hypothetical protein
VNQWFGGKMKFVTHFMLLLGALPLLVYPFVVLANVMSLAGERSGNEPPLLMLVVYSFLLGSLAYPAVYVPCALLAVARVKKNDDNTAFWYVVGPLGYLLLLAGLLAIWSAIS